MPSYLTWLRGTGLLAFVAIGSGMPHDSPMYLMFIAPFGFVLLACPILIPCYMIIRAALDELRDAKAGHSSDLSNYAPRHRVE